MVGISWSNAIFVAGTTRGYHLGPLTLSEAYRLSPATGTEVIAYRPRQLQRE